jgi:NAD(P)-dependent dehydrogenase (short-subunit alcohol dehydrogenase family)
MAAKLHYGWRNAGYMMCNLSGKVALITGLLHNSVLALLLLGIGAATAVLFARLGAKLAITGRNESNLQEVSKSCSQHLAAEQESPLLLIGDLTSEQDVKRMVDRTVEKFGRLDILVNNAGVLEFGSIETTSLEQYDRVMNVNVRAIYHLTMLAVPHLVKTQGSIVNVSSVNGTSSFSGVLAYCLSKSAVDQLTKCTALELAPKKVRVNSVNPGVVLTELQKRGGTDR